MSSAVQKIRMLGGMLTGERAFTGPAYVVLDLTRRCNTKCVGCWYHCVQERQPTPGDHSVRDLPVALLQRLASELSGMGTAEIFLLGEGEPLLHPGFFEIFRDYGGMFEDLAVGDGDRPALEAALAEACTTFAAHGIRHDIPQYLERVAMGPESWTKLPCYAGWYASQIKVDGTVLPCAH